MPLFYHDDVNICVSLMHALYAGGVRLIEFTNRGSNALSNFNALKKAASQYPDLLLGTGTIKRDADALAFINAGADFLISPALIEDVFDVAYNNKILWIPGCMTPTEIVKAEGMGVSLVKLFPGSVLGPSFMKAIKDLFPGIAFMPTGGVESTEENLRQWFSAGVVAVGMGSNLVNSGATKEGGYEKLTAQAAEILERIRQIKLNP